MGEREKIESIKKGGGGKKWKVWKVLVLPPRFYCFSYSVMGFAFSFPFQKHVFRIFFLKIRTYMFYIYF